MAQFIKVGNKYINLENVTEVMDKAQDKYPTDKVVVCFAGDDSEGFEGESAAALRSYFNSIASDVVETYHAKLAEDKYRAEWKVRFELATKEVALRRDSNRCEACGVGMYKGHVPFISCIPDETVSAAFDY